MPVVVLQAVGEHNFCSIFILSKRERVCQGYLLITNWLLLIYFVVLREKKTNSTGDEDTAECRLQPVYYLLAC